MKGVFVVVVLVFEDGVLFVDGSSEGGVVFIYGVFDMSEVLALACAVFGSSHQLKMNFLLDFARHKLYEYLTYILCIGA